MSCCRSDAAVESPPRIVQTVDCGTAADPNDRARNKNSERKGMEDEYVTLLNHQDCHSFFAVFDGHGGSQVASYCRQNMHNIFFQKLHGSLPDETELSRAWQEAYASVDEDIRTRIEDPDAECAGSTSTTVFVTPEHQGWLLSVANTGDSKAMLYSPQTGTCKIITATHRPSNEEEVARIKEAGGWLAGEKSKRLNGRLAITRALGDHFIKKTTKGLVSLPSVTTTHVMVPSVLIIASDGLWDFAEEEVKRYLFSEDVLASNPQQIARTLLEMAIRQNSNDNIAIVVVFLTQKLVTDSGARSPLTRRERSTVG